MLNTGNYAPAENTFAYTVAKLPFSGTAVMESYAYGDEVPTPAIEGYAGDGKVTIRYRAVDSKLSMLWQNITPTTLAPGEYLGVGSRPEQLEIIVIDFLVARGNAATVLPALALCGVGAGNEGGTVEDALLRALGLAVCTANFG